MTSQLSIGKRSDYLLSAYALRNILLLASPLLFAALGGCMLAASFIWQDAFSSAWLAFVPLLFAVNNRSLAQHYCLGFCFGISFYLFSTPWVSNFIALSKSYDDYATFASASLFWIYCAQLPAIMILAYGFIKTRVDIHEFLLFPITVSFFYAFFPMLFPVQLGESQLNFILAIQAVDIVGVYGLDALIALVNIFVFRSVWDLFIDEKSTLKLKPGFVVIAIIFVWFCYGWFAQKIWTTRIEEGSTLNVGIVESNERVNIVEEDNKFFPKELAMSTDLAEKGAELIIWSEGRAKNYLDDEVTKYSFQNHVSNIDAGVLFHDLQDFRGGLEKYSTALFLDNTGRLMGQYQKIKLIPFFENLPLLLSGGELSKLLKGILGSASKTIVSGDKRSNFKYIHEEKILSASSSHSDDEGEVITIVPLICYETLFPVFVARGIPVDGSKNLLIALSNNAWFDSALQSRQHARSSALRAVENRVTFIHVLNNGGSLVVLPNGSVQFQTEFGVGGAYQLDVAVANTSSRSMFSQYPMVTPYILVLSLVYLIVRALQNKPRNYELI